MDWNAASEIHSAYGQHFKRQIAGLAPHDGNHRFDGRYTARAGIGGIERGLDDGFGAIAGRGDPLRYLGLLWCLFAVAEEVVYVRNANPGTHVLVTHVIEPLAHECEQANLRLVDGRKVRMPAFRA